MLEFELYLLWKPHYDFHYFNLCQILPIVIKSF